MAVCACGEDGGGVVEVFQFIGRGCEDEDGDEVMVGSLCPSKKTNDRGRGVLKKTKFKGGRGGRLLRRSSS
ncbi:hypothetical protein A4A49_10613 [Nicotiana attenuata]|uniref:Uncharacterized protein n=1 Tax=Nicotiana attenuata TaxID=49451 RepID=A0A314KPT7_NICAT|nr:hypothetical protein A4A49_10613 [Nicotiana attenuata]